MADFESPNANNAIPDLQVVLRATSHLDDVAHRLVTNTYPDFIPGMEWS